MFDKDGKALESWNVYRDVTDYSLKSEQIKVSDIDYLDAQGSVGIPVSLPEQVLVTFSDDHMETLPISWENAAPVFDQDGDYTVTGKIPAIGQSVDCDIEIKPKANLLKNGDFETMSLAGWTVEGDKWTVTPTSGKGDAKGQGSMHYWGGGNYHFTMSQEVTGLTDGKYTVQVSSQGKYDDSKFQLFVIGDNGEKKTVPITNNGWNKWQTVKITDVEIKGGKAVVGLEMQGKPDKWGSADNFKFYRQD
jgi:arabinogalactan endo-1,4-beta-galactosidase